MISLGAGVDIDFGELLDCAAGRPGDRRHPALRGDGARRAALHVGAARRRAHQARGRAEGGPLARRARRRRAGLRAGRGLRRGVRRAGTVRVRTYTQLFAAARILVDGQASRAATASRSSPTAAVPRSSRPTARVERGVRLAEFGPATLRGAGRGAARGESCAAIPSTCAARRRPSGFAAAVAATLADPGVDAVLALHVPRPSIGADRCGARRRGGDARPGQAGAGRVARRDRPARGARSARGRRHRELLHARECGRGVLVSRVLPAPPGAGCSRCRRRSPRPKSRTTRRPRPCERRPSTTAAPSSPSAGRAAARGVRPGRAAGDDRPRAPRREAGRATHGLSRVARDRRNHAAAAFDARGATRAPARRPRARARVQRPAGDSRGSAIAATGASGSSSARSPASTRDASSRSACTPIPRSAP